MTTDKPHPEQDADFTMRITETEIVPGVTDGYQKVIQHTSRGDVEARYYTVEAATQACIFVGGAGGEYASPIRGRLYPALCHRLQQSGTAAIHVRFRQPASLEESSLDVLAFVSFLEDQAIESMGIVGHALGAAVAIQAASHAQSIRTCVALAAQSYGAEPAADLGPRCSLLVCHGADDQILPPECSRFVHRIARAPKRLVVRNGIGHDLLEWEEELPHIVYDWLIEQLKRPEGDEPDPRAI